MGASAPSDAGVSGAIYPWSLARQLERGREKMRTKVANGLARILKVEGVSWVSTFPVCSVNNALGDEGIPLLMMREERYAVAVADAFSRVTGGRQIGVCTVMGAINPAGLQMAYGALAQAFEDSSPVLCISDGVPAGATGTTRFDITEAFRTVTKWIGHIDQPQRMPEFMRRAFTYLRTGRPGPVLVTLPRSLGGAEYDAEEYPYIPVKGWRAAPDTDDVKAAIKAFRAAENPLLYIGEGIYYGDATAELLQFAEMAQVPVMTTLKAKVPSRRITLYPWACEANWPLASCANATCFSPSAPASPVATSVTSFPTLRTRPSSSVRWMSWTSTRAIRWIMPSSATPSSLWRPSSKSSPPR